MIQSYTSPKNGHCWKHNSQASSKLAMPDGKSSRGGGDTGIDHSVPRSLTGKISNNHPAKRRRLSHNRWASCRITSPWGFSALVYTPSIIIEPYHRTVCLTGWTPNTTALIYVPSIVTSTQQEGDRMTSVMKWCIVHYLRQKRVVPESIGLTLLLLFLRSLQLILRLSERRVARMFLKSKRMMTNLVRFLLQKAIEVTLEE